MKSLLLPEYCDEEISTPDYKIGIFKRTSKLGKLGYEVQNNELACRFQGILSCINFLENNQVFGNRQPNTNTDESYKTHHDNDWTRYSSYDEAVKVIRKSPESFRDFTEADIRLTDINSAGNNTYFETTGDFLDVGRFMEGQPECFGVMCDGRIQHRFCSIIVSLSTQCDVRRETVATKASRVLRLVDALEANNIRCELSIFSSNQCCHMETIVKHYNDPLDINDFAVALSPDFFRWCVFRLTEHSDTMDYGYGHAALYNGKLWIDDDADNTIYIDGLNTNNKDKIIKQFDNIEKEISEGFPRGETYSLNFNY